MIIYDKKTKIYAIIIIAVAYLIGVLTTLIALKIS